MTAMTVRHAVLVRTLLILIAITAAFNFGVSSSRATSGSSGKNADKQKKDRSSKKDAPDEKGQPVLWRQPENIESLDLFYGPGGAEKAPDLSAKFTYERRDTNGTQKKIIVKDDKGGEWTVKYGPEARPETAATRIVWAMGYHADEDYFVKTVQIEGVRDPAIDVRFKRRHDGYKDVGRWSWESNPFIGTRELAGLKVLMLVLNNWDLKTSNNKILKPSKKEGGDSNERIYYVGDLGATFGKTGSLARELHVPNDPPAGSKDRPDQYARQTFVSGSSDGFVKFHYKGKDQSTVKGISADNARWMGNMLAQLSDKQLSDAFRAAGYDDSEISTLISAMRQRIAELQNIR